MTDKEYELRSERDDLKYKLSNQSALLTSAIGAGIIITGLSNFLSYKMGARAEVEVRMQEVLGADFKLNPIFTEEATNRIKKKMDAMSPEQQKHAVDQLQKIADNRI